MAHDLKVSDILVATFMNNLVPTTKFYKVVKATAQTVTVRLMDSICIDITDGGMALIVPSDEGETEIGEPFKRIVKHNRIWVDDNTTARAWGCIPMETDNVYM